LKKGFLDAIVHRRDLKDYLIRALDFLQPHPCLTQIPSHRKS
jgi:acetyl-CoA carboxylase beta subunit